MSKYLDLICETILPKVITPIISRYLFFCQSYLFVYRNWSGETSFAKRTRYPKEDLDIDLILQKHTDCKVYALDDENRFIDFPHSQDRFCYFIRGKTKKTCKKNFNKILGLLPQLNPEVLGLENVNIPNFHSDGPLELEDDIAEWREYSVGVDLTDSDQDLSEESDD